MADPRTADVLDALLDLVAEHVADRVVDKLRGGDMAGYVDQSQSPLGRRRHIAAVKSGKLPGKRVGRRYLVRGEDLDAFIARGSGEPRPQPVADGVDQLAQELGLVRKEGR